MKRLYIIFTITGLLVAQNSVVRQFSEAFADVAEKAKPAVVTIVTNKKISMNWPEDNDMFFFFSLIGEMATPVNSRRTRWVPGLL